jgi:hypothetical protein
MNVRPALIKIFSKWEDTKVYENYTQLVQNVKNIKLVLIAWLLRTKTPRIAITLFAAFDYY